MEKRLTKSVSALILTTLLSLTSSFVFGQTTLIDPNGSGGFEQGVDFAANGWTVVNTTTTNGSKWFNTQLPLTSGSYLFEPTGTNAAYVSNDGGTNWQYNSTANAVASTASHFYRDVTFPSGETNINLSFRLNSNGENNWDELLVFLCPTTLTPVMNSPSGSSTSPTWTGTGTATLIQRTSVMAAGGGSVLNFSVPPSAAGNCSANSTMRLVFTWKNDAGGNYNPPAAIDDISLTTAVPTAITAAGGTFTINNTLATSGTNFATFTAAINALNLANACGALTGSVVFNVSAGQIFNEATPVITASGTATNTITFQKSGTGANPVIIPFGTSGSSDAGIILSGADYVTFDGIDVNASSINTVEYGFIVRNNSATNGAQNNTIRNSVITMNSTILFFSSNAGIMQSTTSTFAGGVTATSAAGANSNNKYYNLTISNAYNGIYLNGTSGFRDIGTEIGTTACTIRNTFTNLGPTGSSNTFYSSRGIFAINQEAVKFFNNDISNVTSNQATAFGIYANSIFGANEIYNNKVSGVANIGSTTTTSIAYGMQIQLATAVVASAKIYNNAISNVYTSFTGTATTTRRAIGLWVGVSSATSTQVYEVDNNSISIGSGLTPTYSNSCFEIQNISAVYKVRNNIFANLTGAQGATARHACWATTTTNIGASGSLSNYNDLFVLNDVGVSGFTGVSTTTTYYATIANWTAAMIGTASTDTNSIAVNPNFINGNTDLHSAALGLNGAGTAAQAWVTADLECAARTPDNDLGAYIINACSGTPTAGTISGLTSVCSGTGTTLTLTGASTAAGTNIQWASSTVSGGPYTNLGTLFSQATGSLTAQTFYIATATCSVSGLSASTAEFSVAINALPTVAVDQATGLICLPGGSSIPLTASGANSYAWSPATGLSAATGATVTANPTATTTYTVTGTGSNGCVNTATSVITVAPKPSLLPVSATPPSVCSGASSQLSAIAPNPAASAYTFAASSGTFTPLTGGTAVTTGTTTPTAAAFLADDVISTVIPIGFSFPFGGVNQTSLIASSNGYLIFNTAITSASASNALATSSNPVIAPLWDDLDGVSGASPSASYTTTGTPGSRVFTIQWLNWQWNYNATGAQISFQVKLYEATGKIEMIYRPESGTINTPSASIGIASSTGNYLSLNGTGTAPTASSTTETTSLSTAPVSGQTYSFTPAILTTPTYSWSPATFLSSTSIANPMATNVTATTTYNVTVTNPSTCFSSASVTLTAGSTLTSSAGVSPNDTICSGLNLTLQATPAGGGAPYTYAWSGPDAFTSTAQNPVISAITVAKTGSYSVVITDDCGASTTSSINIVVNQSPTVTATPASTLFCSPGTGITINASGASTYAWSPATTLSAATGATVVALPAAATVYTVVGTATNGCIGTATSSIAVSPSLTMNSVTASPSAVCNGGNSALEAKASLNISYCQPTYSVGTGSGDYISSVKLNTLSNTTAGSSSPYFTLYPAADSTTTTLTAGSTYSLILKAGTYTDNDLAAWIDYDQNSVLGNVPVEKLGEKDNLGAAPASTTFTFTVPTTALNGKVRLRVREMDHSTTNDMTPCANQSSFGEVEDYIITITGGVDPISYSWSPSTALSATNTASVSATNLTTTTTYTATATSVSGCTASGAKTVLVKQPTDATISTSACASYTAPSGTVYTTSGTYVDIITNSVGCDSVITINLTINPLPTINAGADVTVCAGNSVTLTATSNVSTIAWNNSVTNATAFTPTATGSYIATATSAAGCVKKDTVVVTVNNLPFVFAGNDFGVCSGNSTSLNAVSNLGGNPVTFAWNNSVVNAVSFVPTATSTYIVTGTDLNGCINRDTVQVQVYNLPAVNAGTDATVCAGTMVTLSGSGASTYAWNNNATNGVAFAATATTTYTVTGTDTNGCVNTDSKVVTVNSLPNVNAGNDLSVCQFGQAILSASGATSYAWNGGITNNVSFIVTQTKTYTVTGTDANGCSKSDSVVVTMLGLPSVNAGNNITQCGNQSVTLSGTGAQVYSWNNGIQNGISFNAPFGTTAYILTGIDAFGCSNTDIVLVTINTIPTASAALTNTISLNASPAGSTYQWINCATNTPILGETNQLFTATVNGSYSVVVTSPAGCVDTSSCVSISKVGLDDLTGDASARLYPNPTNGSVFVSLNSIESVDAFVYDAQGKLIETIKGLKDGSVIDLKSVETGVYMIHLNSAAGSMVQRIVKQ